jgi:cytochrome c biogenesis protein CcmG, thiol:disulfide interchange protein DsbE
MNRTVLIVGAAIALALLAVLFLGLGNDPTAIHTPLIGKQAPNFALKAVNGSDMIDISKLRGKPVVVNFWATWCHPCWDEHPTLTAVSQTYGDNVQFLGVVFQDDESKITNFLRERGWAYPTLVDERGKTAIAYGVGGVPETFFLNRQGKIVAKYVGPISPDELRTDVAKAMAQ